MLSPLTSSIHNYLKLSINDMIYNFNKISQYCILCLTWRCKFLNILQKLITILFKKLITPNKQNIHARGERFTRHILIVFSFSRSSECDSTRWQARITVNFRSKCYLQRIRDHVILKQHCLRQDSFLQDCNVIASIASPPSRINF